MEKISKEAAETIKSWFENDKAKELVESTQKATDSDTGTFQVVITTENIDRYDEVIKMDGWELDHYLANPVVLWGHDHTRLIGVATSLEVKDGKLVASGKFAPTEEGQEKRKLYEQGFLKATSVGFIEKEREGNLITKAELLEFSFVSVPANPYALSLAMEKEMSINELVTKGIFTLKDIKDVSDTEAEPISDTVSDIEDTPAEAVDDATGENDGEETEPEAATDTPEVTDEQKALANLITKQVIAAIKDGALEADTVEPEGTEDDDEVDTPEEKAFRIKKALQNTDTLLGEVLAEMRQRKSL